MSTMTRPVRRRTLVAGLAWTTPAMTLAAVAPAYAASTNPCPTPTYTVSKTCGTPGTSTSVVFTFCAATGATIAAGSQFSVTTAATGFNPNPAASTTNGTVAAVTAGGTTTFTVTTATAVTSGGCFTVTLSPVSLQSSNTSATFVATGLGTGGVACPGYPSVTATVSRQGSTNTCV